MFKYRGSSKNKLFTIFSFGFMLIVSWLICIQEVLNINSLGSRFNFYGGVFLITHEYENSTK